MAKDRCVRFERSCPLANRRRKGGKRGRCLMRRRGELVERTFAHAFETGGMRRTYLRHHGNIAKRLLIHIAGLNLGILMRHRFGVGKPRCLQGARPAALRAAFSALVGALVAFLNPRRQPLHLATILRSDLRQLDLVHAST